MGIDVRPRVGQREKALPKGRDPARDDPGNRVPGAHGSLLIIPTAPVTIWDPPHMRFREASVVRAGGAPSIERRSSRTPMTPLSANPPPDSVSVRRYLCDALRLDLVGPRPEDAAL